MRTYPGIKGLVKGLEGKVQRALLVLDAQLHEHQASIQRLKDGEKPLSSGEYVSSLPSSGTGASFNFTGHETSTYVSIELTIDGTLLPKGVYNVSVQMESTYSPTSTEAVYYRSFLSKDTATFNSLKPLYPANVIIYKVDTVAASGAPSEGHGIFTFKADGNSKYFITGMYYKLVAFPSVTITPHDTTVNVTLTQLQRLET